jgi:hypothetical protein
MPRESEQVRQINQRFQTDMALFNELGTDLCQVPADKSLDLLLGDHDCRFLGANKQLNLALVLGMVVLVPWRILVLRASF